VAIDAYTQHPIQAFMLYLCMCAELFRNPIRFDWLGVTMPRTHTHTHFGCYLTDMTSKKFENICENWQSFKSATNSW